MPAPVTRPNTDEQAPAEAPACATRLFWVEIAKKPSAEALPESLQRRMEESKRAFLQAGFSPAGPSTTGARLHLKASYFGGIPRGSIGALCRALHTNIPNSAVLSLSFVGTSALEILCRAPLFDKLTTGIKLLGFRRLPSFNPFSANTGPPRSEKAKLAVCYRRRSRAAT